MAIAVTLFLVGSTEVNASPIPRVLIEQDRLIASQGTITFGDISNKVPQDSRHLVVEVYAAASSGDDGVASVEVIFNGDEKDNRYLNRSLFGKDSELGTSLDEYTASAEVMDLPVSPDSESPVFGSGRFIIPWAFLEDQAKHILSQSGVGGHSVSSNMSHWRSFESINSIEVRLSDGFEFDAGSVIQLYAVDEDYRLGEKVLSVNARGMDFKDIDQGYEGLVVIGQTRSSQVNPLRRGDRVWHSINKDSESDSYQVQRITGEAEWYQVSGESHSGKVLLDQMSEPRIGWNTAQEAPLGVFGPWVIHYPDYTNTDFWRTLSSFHGTHDDHYNPVGNEFGRYKDASAMNSLNFQPLAGRDFMQGSRVGVYATNKSDGRYVVSREGQSEITMDIPADLEAVEFQASVRSLRGNTKEDNLLVKFNTDLRPSKYNWQGLMARDGSGRAVSSFGNNIGSIPSSESPSKLFSNIYGSVRGLESQSNTSLRTIGGVPGEGESGLYALRRVGGGEIDSIAFSTASGEGFKVGSVFTIWFEEGRSVEAVDRGDSSDSESPGLQAGC